MKFSILKSFIVMTLVISPPFTLQADQGISEEQMQQMMEQAKKMQECMAKVDQSALDVLAVKSEKIHKEMKALCDAGNRDQAQKTAIAYSKEISTSKEMKAMKKCTEMATNMMQDMPMMQDMDKDYKKLHICDGI